MTKYFKPIWQREFAAKDTDFIITVDEIWNIGWAYEFDDMSDCAMKKSVKTCVLRVTIKPTGNHNEFNDYTPAVEEVISEIAHDIVAEIINSNNKLFWYAKDLLHTTERRWEEAQLDRWLIDLD